MKFQELAKFDEISFENIVCCKVSKFPNSNLRAIYGIEYEDYRKLYIFASSVVDSFGKLFKYGKASRVSIFIPDNNFLVSLIAVGNREYLELCSKWIDELVKLFPELSKYYSRGDILSKLSMANYPMISDVVPSQYKRRKDFKELCRSGGPDSDEFFRQELDMNFV